MRSVYSIFIFIYQCGIRIAALFNPKAKRWIDGRKNLFEELEKQLHSKLKEGEQIVWFHCASLGEFEQGRPVIENLKTKDSGLKILLTFFSPSGYEVRKNYKHADFIFYLPMDTPANAKRFVETLPLKAAFFVKYEFWFNYLHELKNKSVPTYLVSGIFRADQYFFKWYGTWASKQLNAFTHFFLQNEESKKLLDSTGFENTTVSGDTRFDRVYEIAQNKKEFPLIEKFAENAKVLILGSSWADDEKMIADCRFQVPGLKIIIAPHEIGKQNIQQVISRLSPLFAGSKLRWICGTYSEATPENISDTNMLIIDNIGMLSSLYQYGHVAYIGGGFGDGIHNILEAATFGLPTIFGPNYKKFNEAIELIDTGGSFAINNTADLEAMVNKLFNDSSYLRKASEVSRNYVSAKKGATEIILNAVKLT